MFIEDQKPLRDAISSLMEKAKSTMFQIDHEMECFVMQCREDRKAKRHQITREQGKSQFSHLVLLYRCVKGNSEVTWNKIWYPRNSSKPRYKRLPTSKGAVHLSRLPTGAHVDEVSLIRLQEAQARAYRELNSRIHKIRNEIESLSSRYEILTGAELRARLQSQRQAEQDPL